MMSTGAVMGEVPAFETSCRASIYIVGIGREFARIYLKLTWTKNKLWNIDV